MVLVVPFAPPAYAAVFGRVCFKDLPASDVARWLEQPLQAAAATEGAPFPLLQQTLGGPCSLLAALQGYMLVRHLLIRDLRQARSVLEKLPVGTEPPPIIPSPLGGADAGAGAGDAGAEARAAALEHLAHAVAFMLWQATTAPEARPAAAASAAGAAAAAVPPRFVALVDFAGGVVPADGAAFTAASPSSQLAISLFNPETEYEALVAAARASLTPGSGGLASPAGSALLLFSLVLSRGVDRVERDEDEATPLVARFGHGTQELLNLALTGQAVSGIFDGVQSVGEGGGASGDITEGNAGGAAAASSGPGGDVLQLLGVQRRPLLGYLSRMEALGYDAVGEHYKSPLAPVWVIGSESHFTVLFSPDRRRLPLISSPFAPIVAAFKAHEMSQGAMMVPSDKLEAVLTQAGVLHAVTLELDLADAGPEGAGWLSPPEAVVTLRSRLDPDGLGFVVWGAFWDAVGPLVLRAAGRDPVFLANLQRAQAEAAASPAARLASLWKRLQTTFTALDAFQGGFIPFHELKTLLKRIGHPWVAEGSEGGSLKPASGPQNLAALAVALGGTGTPADDAADSGNIVLYDDLQQVITPSLEAMAGMAGGGGGGAGAPGAASASPAPSAASSLASIDLLAGMRLSGGKRRASAPAVQEPAAAPAPLSANAAAAVEEAAALRTLLHAASASPVAASSGAAPVSADGDAASSHSRSQRRVFELYHYNGLRGGTLAKLSVAQSNALSVLAPDGSATGVVDDFDEDEGAAGADSKSNKDSEIVALDGADDDTSSSQPVGGSGGGEEVGGGGEGGSDYDTLLAATAASMMDDVGDPELARAMAESLLASQGTFPKAASAGASAAAPKPKPKREPPLHAFRGILRTKWAGAGVKAVGGLLPSIH